MAKLNYITRIFLGYLVAIIAALALNVRLMRFGSTDDDALSTVQIKLQANVDANAPTADASLTIATSPESKSRDSAQTKTKSVAVTDSDSDSASTSIRKWGCDRTETPLIFVHIGKAGGGNIRARLAAASHNYTRKQWTKVNADGHYYPIELESESESNESIHQNDTKNKTIRHGKFCNSIYPHYVMNPHIETPLDAMNYEGFRNCNATTPLGMAVACHNPHIGIKKGHINLKHYRNQACGMCDDDFYLDVNYYFGNMKTRQRDKKSKGQFKFIEKVPLPETVFDPREDPPPETTCDNVMVSHNNIGSELNWLPPRYLKEHWWDNSEYGIGQHDAQRNIEGGNGNGNSNSEPLERYWARLLDDRHRRRKEIEVIAKGKAFVESKNESDSDTSHRWCPNGYKYKTKGSMRGTISHDRPLTDAQYRDAYEPCGLPLAEQADRAFLDTFFPDEKPKNFSPFYASMPLHRITVMRDPWSWIISKFFWHRIGRDNPGVMCHNVTVPTLAKGVDRISLDPFTGRELGWCQVMSILHLIQLCGNDCRVRYENAMMTLEEMEAQAASNLRNAFSVVGLLQESESFYDMVMDRIRYVDMELNMEVDGKDHSTFKAKDNLRCKTLFGTDEVFRESVRQQVPAFAALERLYHVAIEVNAFQKEELRQCKLAKGEEPTKGTYKKLEQKLEQPGEKRKEKNRKEKKNGNSF